MSQEDPQALIDETETLGWDKPNHLVARDGVLNPHEGFAFIGKLLALKAQNIYHVRAMLSSVWSFAAPLSMKVMGQNKYLFMFLQESHFHNIIRQGPWNVRGSLLLLQPWSPELAIDEVKLQFCAFWVQVYDLPRKFMTTKNAIKIGMGIGKIMELDNNNSSALISRQFIRFKIEINTSLPLALGFYMPCDGSEPR